MISLREKRALRTGNTAQDRSNDLARPRHAQDRIRVRIFHQFDPAGLIPGGVPTFIRGLIKAAPDDIQFSVVGLTTDESQRPVGQWTNLELGRGRVAFFPVSRDHDPGGRSRIPLAVRFTAGIARYRKACSSDCDILEFHRFEPTIPLFGDRRPKNAFVHQNMDVIRNASSDIKWKHAPALYFALERHVIPRFDSVFCVREDAVEKYRREFTDIANRFTFIPTWADPETFKPASRKCSDALRVTLGEGFGFSPGNEILLSVGRLDQQKDPLLLVEAFARIHAVRETTRLIIVGDGVLRPAIVTRINALGLKSRVVLAGLRDASQVSQLLQISNAFLLTSAYEGMPMSVIEALACGVPVVTTDVGEVRKVVRPGVNGEVVNDHSPEAVARATLELLSRGEVCRGLPCVEAVQDFVPDRILARVYRNYRTLAGVSS